MNDEQLLRYNRHIMLPQIGFEGQQKLRDAHVLIIGLGGLGSPAALYLATAGIGQLTLVDDDEVELSNLQRQIIHRNQNIGEKKVASAKSNLLAINDEVDIVTIDHRLDESSLAQQIQLADVVLDASDNFDTRFAINRPATLTRTGVASSASFSCSPYSACSSPAMALRRKSFGKQLPFSRKASSLARRWAISEFSSCSDMAISIY